MLIVDDQPGVRRLLVEALRQAGFKVSMAASGEEGLRKILTEKPSLAIVDMKMPGMNGVDFLRELHKRSYHLPVIAITAYEDKELAEQAQKLGARYLLHKPFDLSTLYTMVNSALTCDCCWELEAILI
ncbi:MAG: response regulator [Thermoanaerobacteraceae bacterium]|nr:response regulator [Thermoanaerobacteraceae bacterium]